MGCFFFCFFFMFIHVLVCFLFGRLTQRLPTDKRLLVCSKIFDLLLLIGPSQIIVCLMSSHDSKWKVHTFSS